MVHCYIRLSLFTLIFAFFILFSSSGNAQVISTETFETETSTSTSFTDNGQVFNISTQVEGPFDIQTGYPGTGWNGTAADNRYIDNDSYALPTGTGVQFTISSAGGTPFQLKSIYLYLATSYNNLSVTGSCTITGKLAGSTVFTATSSAGFVNSLSTNNGFTYINLATYGSANNANTNIDQYVVTTTGNINYVALDAMTWSTVPNITVGTLNGTSFCSGAKLSIPFTSNSSFTGSNVFTAQLSNASGSFSSPVTIGTLTSTSASGTIQATIPVSTSGGSGYRIRVISSSPSLTGSDNGTNLTITNTTSTGTTFYLAAATTSQTSTVSSNVTTYFSDASCRAIASLIPTGAAMGSTTAKVYVLSTAPNYNISAYVRRYYDITPTTNSATATATVTLYFTQSDFTDYNTFNGTMPDLPTGPSDVTGIANLRVTQQHGVSATGALGSYSGWSGSGAASVLIDPADANIVWNNSESRWEVTFTATGFSGFFVSGNPNGFPLSVKLESFTAKNEGLRNRLDWKTAVEEIGTTFEIERSSDGQHFSLVNTIKGQNKATEYVFYDDQLLNTTTYYRLKITGAGSSSAYSNTVLVQRNFNNENSVSVWPQPMQQVLNVMIHPSLIGTKASVYTTDGRLVTQFTCKELQQIEVQEWPGGVYILRLADGNAVKIIK